MKKLLVMQPNVPERVVVPKENNKSAEKVTLSSVVFSSLSSFYDVHTLLEPLKSKENNKFLCISLT